MNSNSGRLVVIVGCGRLGSHLANRLSGDGHDVVVIDAAEKSFISLSGDFSGFTVEGDATEIHVLRQAGIERADVLIAATRNDNINLMVAQIATKYFKVRRAIARVTDPQREKAYQIMGVETFCPTIMATDRIAKILGDNSLSQEGGA